jgi:hypothetical protein
VQSGERGIGRDQAVFGVDPPGDGLRARAHAASAAGRERVETRATLAR